ncbi:DUF5361 domain-containing protein [Enterococcus faecium]|nr:DUF5361 domain-containing protein [Enterococcus faecium]EMF0264494.1 DUF5361 domain-containing protein [Enterococcus hirae]EMF0428605.1 DUF5361 domain-containing protein [Enterococcus faecium]
MIQVDEEALMCDLAETYHIYDYKQLPVSTVAVFSCGLKPDSRIHMKLNNQQVPLDTLLLASISDKLGLLIWFKTKDGQKGVNRPASISDSLTNSTKQEKNEIVFNSGEEFERVRKRLIEGGDS